MTLERRAGEAEHVQPVFLSDGMTRACPQVLAAVVTANEPDRPYDEDGLTGDLDRAFSDLFETPVTALWVLSGTAANGLAIAAMTHPGDGIICHPISHINMDEAGAPEFFGHGVKMLPLNGADGKLSAHMLANFLEDRWQAVHRTQPAMVSITNATEQGGIYRPDEIRAIADIAHGAGLSLHMDGARFANAIAAQGCSPADLTWRAGVDALSFGFTKNGGLCADAVVFFDRERAQIAKVRRKRAGHLPSKGRFLAAQLHALLADGLWLRNGSAANARAQMLARDVTHLLATPVEANMLFLKLDAAQQLSLSAAGYRFHRTAPDVVRIVMAYDQPNADIDRLRDILLKL